MIANEAPEKIHISKDLFRWSFNGPQSKSDIEYIRIDAFIEKIIKWIESTFSMDYNESEMNAIIKEFKEYMKGE